MTEKQQISLQTTKRYVLWSMGATLIPLPWVDLAAVGAVELKMLSDLSRTYGVPFHRNRGKAIIAALTAFVLPHALAFGTLGSLLKAIPAVGPLAGTPAMALFCGAYTWALGNVFIQHFESGGTFLDFHPAEVREYFRSQFENGRKMAANMSPEEKAEVPA